MFRNSFQKITTLFFTSLALLVFSFNTHSFAMEEDEFRKTQAPKQTLPLEENDDVFSLTAFLESIKERSEKKLLTRNAHFEQMEKDLEAIKLTTRLLERRLLEQRKKQEAIKKERDRCYILMATLERNTKPLCVEKDFWLTTESDFPFEDQNHSELSMELKVHILSLLEQGDLLRVGGVSKRWRQATEKIWKTKILDFYVE